MRKVLSWILTLILAVQIKSHSQDFYAYYTRTDFADKISGKYADIIINLKKGKVVFSRESSYLPKWITAKGEYYFEEIIERAGDGTKLKPDKFNRHSYVRIIENNPDKIIIHWRYYPHILHTEMTDVVHELFTFTPDLIVKHEIKVGTKTIDEWNNKKYTYSNNLILGDIGIKKISSQETGFEPDYEPIKGNPIIKFDKEDLLAYFSLDEGMKSGKDFVKDEITNIEVPVLGHKTYWTKGVSGTALKFDGYFSGVEMPVQYSPQISEEFTIEAWVNMAAHPFGWVPIVEQANFGKSGYYFGINAYGEIGFLCNINGNWNEVITQDTIYINKWHHLAATFNTDSKTLKVYLDGSLSAEKTLNYEEEGLLIHGNSPLSIGLNTDRLSALPKPRYEDGQFPTITGFEGAIDEIRFYTYTLSDEQIKNSFNNVISSVELNHDIFHKRILPGNPGYASSFGAEYTKLEYHPMWDNTWRTSDYPDISVKFDELPTSVVFWRGPSYGMGWVTEKNYWMIDQSVEWGNARSLVEHMSDKQGRYTHVRLIENTDARVVVHWRYNSNDVLYSFAEVFGKAGLWVDEYITIYPDGVGIRKVEQKADGWKELPPERVSWQDVQFAAQPGMTPDEVMNLEAIHLANMNGEIARLSWEDGVPKENPLPDANIERINFNSDYKVFLAFKEGTFINPWGQVRKDFYTHFMTWNHWPCAFIHSAGKTSLFPTRVTHSALCAADNAIDHGNMAMYGFTEQNVETLVPLVKSWNYPPQVIKTENCESIGYDQAQRAYIIKFKSDHMKIIIDADESSPIVNPCFVVKNWDGKKNAVVKINDSFIEIGNNNRQGIVRDTDGIQMMVVWLKLNSAVETIFELERSVQK